MTTKAAIYLRISLDQTGEGLAVDRQREDCLKMAADRGWTVSEVYADNSISASDRNVRRPAYDRMVADHQAGKFDALVCWDLDRLTRQPRQLEDWIDQAEIRGLQLVTANGEADLTTDGGRMFARIKAAVARGEIDRKSARQARASKQRADLGKPPGGIRLTGYGPTKEKPVPKYAIGEQIPDEAKMVVDIFEKFVEGKSIVGLVKYLTKNNVPTRSGKPWTRTSVTAMLRNPRYAGRAVYLGEVTGKPGNWDPIVKGDLFDVVQAILDDPKRKTNRVGTDRKHLGTSLYRCGECGGTVNTSGHCYVCLRCSLLRTRAQVDSLVVETIRERLGRPDLADLIAPSNNGRVAALEAQAKALRNQKAIAESDYDAGLIDGVRFQARNERITAELHTVDVERITMLSSSAVSSILTAHDPVTAFDSAGLGERRAIVGALLDVQLLRARRGRIPFDRETVSMKWKAAA